MQGQTQKKATEEQVKKMAKGLMLNHDKMQGALTSTEVSQTLRTTDDMDGISAALGDVSMLVPEDGEEKQAEAETPEKEDDVEEAEEKKPKKEKWFDKDRQVLKAHRALEAALGKVRSSADQAKEQLASALQKVDSLNEAQKKQVRGEVLIGQSRLECLEKVYGTNLDLSVFISELKKAASTQGVGGQSVSSTADPMKAFLSAPPCKSFADLVSFDTCEAEGKAVMEATSTDEIEQVKTHLSSLRAPITELVAACKSATSDINKGLKALESQAKRKSQPGKKSVVSPNQGDIFSLTGHCLKPSIVAEGSNFLDGPRSVDINLPFLIQCDADKHQTFEQTESVKKFMIGDFWTVFHSQSSAQKCDRAHRRFPAGSEIRSSVISRLKEVICTSCPSAEDVGGSEDVAAALDAFAVVVAKNTLTCSPERSHVGSEIDLFFAFGNAILLFDKQGLHVS